MKDKPKKINPNKVKYVELDKCLTIEELKTFIRRYL